MQAGTTGVNLIRIYNPIKNSIEHDPNGIFIKKWIPELNNIPTEFIHEPWKISEMESKFYNFNPGVDYPRPIVDLKKSSMLAKEKVWKHLKDPKVINEKKKHQPEFKTVKENVYKLWLANEIIAKTKNKLKKIVLNNNQK